MSFFQLEMLKIPEKRMNEAGNIPPIIWKPRQLHPAYHYHIILSEQQESQEYLFPDFCLFYSEPVSCSCDNTPSTA